MNERLLQFIWQHLYFNQDQLKTESGEPIQILFQGTINHHQGPDFLFAKLQINQVVWVGNIELHVKTSDWNKHGHSFDQHYDNIILHVVWEHDLQEPQSIPLLELKNRIPSALLSKYNILMQQHHFISCEAQFTAVPTIILQSWKDRMVAERLSEKSEKIKWILEQTNHHWEETCWRLLAGNFGQSINKDAFELIASTIPLQLLNRIKTNLLHVEAILLGQAGLLNESFSEAYPILLQKEFQFLQKKYRLKRGSQRIHFLRMRPSNFPTVRLAQLAMLMHQTGQLFSTIIEIEDLKSLKDLLSVTASSYWDDHYLLNQSSEHRIKHVGQMMINNLLINTVIPLLFMYAERNHQAHLKQKAILWLQQLPSEKNHLTSQWEHVGIIQKTAFDSQAFLFLKKQYCDQKQCLHCAIGNHLLRKGLTS